MARGLSEVLRGPVSSNGHGPPVEAGLVVAGRVRRRPTWVLVGLGAVVFAMLLGAWVFAAQSRSVSVLVAAKDLAPGEVVLAGDLRVVSVSASTGMRAVQADEQALVVGRAVRGPVPAGTVMNTGLVGAAGAVVPADQIVMGVALDPGAAPSSRLAAGDRVEVLAVAPSTAGSSSAPASPVVVTTGSVWSVEPIGSGASSAGKLWVSLLVPQSAHVEVAQAAADGRLRLGLLGAS